MIERCAPVAAGPPSSPAAAISRLLRQNPGLNQADLARAMGISRARINQLIRGGAPISPATALRLERVSGVSAAYWLKLQVKADLISEQDRLREELQQIRRIASYDVE